MPIGRSRESVQTRRVLFLVTGVAPHRAGALAVRPAPHAHDIDAEIIVLPEIVSGRMARHARGISEYGQNGAERRSR